MARRRKKTKLDKIKKQSPKIALALGILCVILIGYITVDNLYLDKKQDTERDKKIMVAGYDFAINQLITETAKCEPLKVYSGESNVTVIGIDCLR